MVQLSYRNRGVNKDRFARLRRVPYIGVPRAVVERRMQRGQLIGGAQAPVPVFVPHADFFQFQAGAGRAAATRGAG